MAAAPAPDADARFFEELYAHAGSDHGAVPWARMRPNPDLVTWLDTHPAAGRALVVGCGLGDDAEELARRGMTVHAFDVSPTAVGWVRRRFPATTVDYRVADLFALPAEWVGRHDLVVEIRTVQSLPEDRRAAAVTALAATLAPGGVLYVLANARAEDEPAHGRPWPLTRAQLGLFADAGLDEESVTGGPGTGWFEAVYRRPRR